MAPQHFGADDLMTCYCSAFTLLSERSTTCDKNTCLPFVSYSLQY
jgi:hypothetical protein